MNIIIKMKQMSIVLLDMEKIIANINNHRSYKDKANLFG